MNPRRGRDWMHRGVMVMVLEQAKETVKETVKEALE